LRIDNLVFIICASLLTPVVLGLRDANCHSSPSTLTRPSMNLLLPLNCLHTHGFAAGLRSSVVRAGARQGQVDGAPPGALLR
jgi:hypothetical protein